MHNYFRSALILSILLILSNSASAALTIVNSTNTPTATNAVLYATVTGTNAVTNAVTATCYYGTANGGTNTALWAYSSNVTGVSTGAISVTVADLTPATWYYYRWYASDGTTNPVAWASVASNFTTAATAPTNYPAATTNPVAIMADPVTGVPVTPAAFATSWGAVSTQSAAAVQANLDLHEASTNPHSITPVQIGALAVASNLSDIADADIARSNLSAAAQTDLNTLDGRVGTLETNALAIYRYTARTNANEEVIVAATAEGITAERSGTTVTLDGPHGTDLRYVRIRWPYTLGGSFTLRVSTNLLNQTGLADRIPPSGFYAWREDTETRLATANCVPSKTVHTDYNITGMATADPGISQATIGF